MNEKIKETAERVLSLDLDAELQEISQGIRTLLRRDLRKRGLVVAISGGVDSGVAAGLSVRAVGREKVFGLLMPEADSSPESLAIGKKLVRQLGIDHQVEDIAPVLESIGCYRRRDEAIRRVFPDYGPGWKNKIAISGSLEGQFSHFKLIVRSPSGEDFQATLKLREYLEIVAATNFKQRIRKTLEFYHADRLNYAVVGTPNRAEYDQGFFVKNGDGSADLKPMAHLYKTQVYMMARHLGLPEEICTATPTTDTYSLPQGQDEFYYNLPYREMDLALWHLNHDRPASDLADVLGVTTERAEHIYADIRTKRRTTAPLHWPALLIHPVEGPTAKPASSP